MPTYFATNTKFDPFNFAFIVVVMLAVLLLLGNAEGQEFTNKAINSSAGSRGAASATIWTSSYKEAVTQSKQRRLPVMLYFTGSDWCPWCIRLSHEVFNTPDFAAWSRDRVILVKVDFPKNYQLPASQTAQNLKLLQKYREHLESYPTILFIDSSEKVVGKLGYQPGGRHVWINRAQAIVGKKDKIASIQFNSHR